MISLKVSSTVAAAALAAAIALPSASFAQHMKFGGGGARAGGGGGVHMGGGGFRGAPGAGAMRFGGGGGPSFAAAPRFNAPAASPRFAGNANAGAYRGPAYAGGGNWNGGNRGGYYRRGGGFYPGLVAGAVIGGAVANSYAYYDPGYAYGTSYYDDDGYVDDSAVAAVPGGDDVASCAQRYRSYDPASQTYLGYDGQRYPCP